MKRASRPCRILEVYYEETTSSYVPKHLVQVPSLRFNGHGVKVKGPEFKRGHKNNSGSHSIKANLNCSVYLDSAHKITPSLLDNKTAQLEGKRDIN